MEVNAESHVLAALPPGRMLSVSSGWEAGLASKSVRMRCRKEKFPIV